jgi:hypothetical protein
MAKGLPVRLTDTVDRRIGLFKQRRGTVLGWTLHPDEASPCSDTERVLDRMPQCIYVKFEDVKWQIGDLEPGVYPLQPKNLLWTVHRELGIRARRYGFRLVPDLAGTAHMYQGATVPAAVVDLQGLDSKPRRADAMAGYIMSSRVKTLATILYAQPFNPALFCLGQAPGPEILMRVLRGELPPEAAEAEFDRYEAEHNATGAEPDSIQSYWRCAACELSGSDEADERIRRPRCT